MEDLSNNIDAQMLEIMQRNAILGENQDMEFVQRILNPELNINPVQNEDGSTSTHSMSAEVDENGDWFVFPTIENTPEGLKRFMNEDGSVMDNQQVREHLKKTGGDMIPFGKDGEKAIKFSQNYKPQAFKDYRTP